jgi:hypothetical protein
MTGSLLVTIVTPIAALIALACWLAMVYWASAHPGWKSHAAGGELTAGGFRPATVEPGEDDGGELAASAADREAA